MVSSEQRGDALRNIFISRPVFVKKMSFAPQKSIQLFAICGLSEISEIEGFEH